VYGPGVDPRTFLPPRALPAQASPRLGSPAPHVPVDLDADRPAVVAFLRHTGCPFAELTMYRLRDAAATWPDIQWIAISHAPEEATLGWCEAIGGPGDVRLVSDPSRRAYATWGLGRTSLGHFFGRRSLTAVVNVARLGIRNRHPHGTRWQMAGTFALDDQRILRWRHLPAHAGDVPELSPAVRAVT
jgi:hypothetical protein